MHYLFFRRGILYRSSNKGWRIPFIEKVMKVPEHYTVVVGPKKIQYSIIDASKAVIGISSHKLFMKLFYLSYYKSHRKYANEVLQDFGLRIDAIIDGRKRPNPQV